MSDEHPLSRVTTDELFEEDLEEFVAGFTLREPPGRKKWMRRRGILAPEEREVGEIDFKKIGKQKRKEWKKLMKKVNKPLK